MNGATYWREREAAKAAALRMAAELSSREKGLAVAAAKRALANDAAHDRTRQRAFERGFLSLDRPDADGDLYDYGDCGREVRRMMRALDAPYRERVRDLRFRAALERIPPDWRAMLKLIRARLPRTEIMRRCGISRATYFRRLACLCATFGAVA